LKCCIEDNFAEAEQARKHAVAAFAILCVARVSLGIR
jgi:hypothetical protein